MRPIVQPAATPLPSPVPLAAMATDFHLPPALEAAEPPEARGLPRDGVRLLVSHQRNDRLVHSTFRHLPEFLRPGDLLLINTSATINAALPAIRADGTRVELHLSTHLPADLWTVEVRRLDGHTTVRGGHAAPGEILRLPERGTCTLHRPYPHERPSPAAANPRLWLATIDVPGPLPAYLAEHGFPIRYGYVARRWPLSAYQTVYATEPGSAEMPSAGRAFTPELLTALIARGVCIAPLLLHTGVASPEDHEPPYEEFYRVPGHTALLVNATRAAGGRVVATGTTVVRALETVTDQRGTAHPGEGWTRLLIGPSRPLRAVDALITGFHEPRSTHLAMLEALSGRPHLEICYAEALRERYLWHEFGDLHLILP